MPGTSLGTQFAICVKLVCLFSASGLASELTRMYRLECVCTRLTLHPSLIVTRLATSFPIALPPVLHPYPALSFSSGSISLATLPFSSATSLSSFSPTPCPVPLLPPLASLPQPHPWMPAPSHPPDPPPVSPSPALTWEVRGVGDG